MLGWLIVFVAVFMFSMRESHAGPWHSETVSPDVDEIPADVYNALDLSHFVDVIVPALAGIDSASVVHRFAVGGGI